MVLADVARKTVAGVLAIIFEARPEAAIQISSLALRSGNALILKGGKEASRSVHAIHKAIQAALQTMTPGTVVTIVPWDRRRWPVH